jgi:hypothetical protein
MRIDRVSQRMRSLAMRPVFMHPVFLLITWFILSCRPDYTKSQSDAAIQSLLFAGLSSNVATCAQPYTGQASVDTIIDQIKSTYGVQPCVNLGPLPLFTLGTVTSSDYANLQTALTTLQTEFARYPIELVLRSRLRMISFPTSIGVPYGGTAGGFAPTELDFIMVRLQVSNIPFLKATIHHEFFHHLDEEKNGPRYYTDPTWRSYNYTYYSYGCNRSNTSAGVISPPAAGFLNTYSTCEVVEDKAEVYSNQFILPNKTQIQTLIANGDTAVAQKLDYVQRVAANFSSSINQTFWNNL